MATGDEIIDNIDRAMWRVNSRSINNVTPFTYSDGLTYIDVLERIRSSVLDVIAFTNTFGEEQDKIIKRINEVVNTFIGEMEKTHAKWDAQAEERRVAIESKMNDFQNKNCYSSIYWRRQWKHCLRTHNWWRKVKGSFEEVAGQY